MLSALRTGVTMSMPRSAVIYARPLTETAFLVDAAADRASDVPDWSDGLYATLAGLIALDLEQKALLRAQRSYS